METIRRGRHSDVPSSSGGKLPKRTLTTAEDNSKESNARNCKVCQHRPLRSSGGEVNVGARWMPWRLVPMKDVVHDEMLRSGVCSRKQPEMSEWGNPPQGTRKGGKWVN
jgi:hypothetical protein